MFMGVNKATFLHKTFNVCTSLAFCHFSDEFQTIKGRNMTQLRLLTYHFMQWSIERGKCFSYMKYLRNSKGAPLGTVIDFASLAKGTRRIIDQSIIDPSSDHADQ